MPCPADFPEHLPAFDPAAAPADPAELFRQWLDEALAAGVPAPNAFSLATADEQGHLSSRMLILKDIDDDGWHFATSRTSRKGRAALAHPNAALNFYWAPQAGRSASPGTWLNSPPKPRPPTGTPAPDRTAATTPTGSCTRFGPAKSNSGRPATTGATSATASGPELPPLASMARMAA